MKKKKLLAVLMGAVMLFTGCSSVPKAAKYDNEIIATVNGSDIHYGQYRKLIELQKETMVQSIGIQTIMNESKENLSQFFDIISKQVLKDIEVQTLLIQEAEKRGLKVDEKDVDAQFKDFKDNLDQNEEFKKFFEEKGITDEYIKDDIRTHMIIQKLIEDESKNDPVTDEKIKEFISQSKDMFPVQYRASHILIKTTDDSGKDLSPEKQKEAKKKIDDIYQKLEKNANDFENLAKEFSEDSSKANGGDLGFFPKGTMVEEFQKVVEGLKVNEISKPFKSRFGYHIVKLTGKMEPEDNEEYKNRVKDMFAQEKLGKLIQKLQDDIKNKDKTEKDKEENKDQKPSENDLNDGIMEVKTEVLKKLNDETKLLEFVDPNAQEEKVEENKEEKVEENKAENKEEKQEENKADNNAENKEEKAEQK